MDSLVNFRDIGGYKTPNGTVVKGKFFRGGEPVKLTDKDKKALVETYQIKHFYDFRRTHETKNAPDDKISGITYHHLNVMKDETVDSSFESMLQVTGSVDASMMGVYKRLINSPAAKKYYREFLESVYDTDQEAGLFHCFAGKDRTGWGAALILKLLGVSDEDIYEDYLLTNEMRKEANERAVQELASTGATQKELDDLRSMLCVKSEYLDYAFSIIEEEYHGFIPYLETALGLGDDFVLRMQERFLIK